MPIRIMIYGIQGEGSAQAAMSQIRALISEMRIDASVQMVTDPAMLAMNGVDTPPAINVDGMFISNGWVPSRNEIVRALRSRLSQVDIMNAPPGSHDPSKRH
jgi:hypothetical protein